MYNSLNSMPILSLYVIVLIVFFIIVLKTPLPNSNHRNNQTNYTKIHDSLNKPVETKVLLIYVWANSHSHAYGNLKYFVDIAVRENDSVDYYFILQRIDNKTIDESKMPLLPKNGHYIQHDNECYDFGTIGWFVNEFTYGNPWVTETITKKKTINLKNYQYFILMNSGIRGPFFPPYFLQFLSDYEKEFGKIFYWYYVFTKRINSKVKLTGCTISCLPVPHVQSYFLVTDFIGLKILLKPGTFGSSGEEGIFGCYPTKNHVSLGSEVPASSRILLSGYMIDDILTKYQGIDFNEDRNRLCNRHRNPYLNQNFDGITLDPYEVIFTKFSDFEFLSIGREKAQLYLRWMEDAKKSNRTIW